MLIANDEMLVASHPLIEAGIKYWQKLARDRAMPRRRELDPTDIPRLLPYTILLDIQHDPLDFYIRVAGQHIIDNYGRTPVRCTINTLISENPSIRRFADSFRLCVQQRRPVVVEDRFVGADDLRKRTYGVILPLADDRDEVSHLLCFSVYLDRDGHQIG
ncbi:MAG: PAS domain-containing protein [Alphaproteobacteria bacterium]